MEEVAAVVNCTPTPQPVHPDIRAIDMKLQLKENVTYIVAGVVIQDGKVLLIQEAKASCRGTWYLPAGRMERDESIVEAVQREVLEESGYQFQPDALVEVESHRYQWVRFTLVGRVVGGSLKTTQQADQESLQAGWFPAHLEDLVKQVRLRAGDILPLILKAGEWFERRLFVGLPVAVCHSSSSQRMVMVHDDGQTLHVLTSGQESGRGCTALPVCLYGREDTVAITIRECGYTGHYKLCGILSVEHSGKPHGQFDGICVTYILRADSLNLTGQHFQWTVITEPLVTQLRAALSDGGCATYKQL